MVLRRPVVVGAGLLLVITVLLVSSGSIGSPEPTVTLENEDTVTYRVTAYTVDNPDVAGFLNFEVTTEDGEQRLVTYEELIWPAGYRNITLVDEGVDSQSFVVEPNETVSESVEGWSDGEMTVYILERGPDREHYRSRTVMCERRGQSHSFTMRDGGGGSSSRCDSGLGWLFR